VPEATYLRVSLFSSLLVRTSRAVPKEAVPTGGTTCSRTLNAAAACNLAATDPLPVSLSLLGILFLCFVSAVSVTGNDCFLSLSRTHDPGCSLIFVDI
jgi:hypothetical protein